MSFLYAALMVYGLSLLIVHGTIFQGTKKRVQELTIKNKILSLFRDKLLEMSNCMLCSSFWIGAAAGAYLGLFPLWNIFANGGVLVGSTWLLNCLAAFLGNGYDPSRTLNVIVSEPVKIIDSTDNKNINTGDKVLIKG